MHNRTLHNEYYKKYPERLSAFVLGAIILLLGTSCLSERVESVGAAGQSECEWCGANEAPKNLSWETVIPDKEEAGEKLIVSGLVLTPDKKTPAPNVLLYVYHTNSKGIYPKRGNETGNGKRHGYLRSWIRTNDKGQYKFTTVKPGSYPDGDQPAHVHITVKEPDKPEYYIDDFIFEGDPNITPQHRSRLQNRGGSGIIRLEKDSQGIWIGNRDIVLEK